MGKKESKKESKQAKASSTPSSPSHEESAAAIQGGGTLSPIAVPLADAKLSKKLFKTIKKGQWSAGDAMLGIALLIVHCALCIVHCALATKAKDIRRGVKEVVKCMRKGQKGSVCMYAYAFPVPSCEIYRLVILAGDVSPMDVLSHVPVLCEEASIPYVFVPSKAELGAVSSTKRPTSCLMISPKPSADYAKYYDEVYQEAKAVALLSSA